jgi:hypothetical protein
VTAGEQPDEDALDHVPLADDDLAHFRHDLVDEAALLRDQLVDRLHVERCLHMGSPSASS